jgi:outer membrane lipoprotein carrier protein
MALQVTGVVLALALPAAPAGAADSGEALARRVDARQAGVRDLTARFVQSYRSGVLGREVTERGTVSIKKPGLMRWEYREPEKKVFVSDGKQFFFYVPADKQVIVKAQDSGQQGVAAIVLGGGKILEHFQAFAEEPLPGRERLRLVPRKADADVQRVYLDVDAGGRVVAIEVWDAQGGHSRFQFEGVKENVGLKDDAFRFQPPAGVEVVTG